MQGVIKSRKYYQVAIIIKLKEINSQHNIIAKLKLLF